MARPEGEECAEALLEGVQRRLRYSSIAANATGGAVVFVLVGFVFPRPPAVSHKYWLLGLNAGLLLLGAALTFPVIAVLMNRLWHSRAAWVAAGREPSERERELTLRFPVTQHVVIAAVWASASVFFAIVNVWFSALLAGTVAITVVLGGLVTVALGYLLAERQLRPITALALASGLPARPQLPGVRARALLTWTAGTGVILLGLALVGLSAIVVGNFTVTKLSLVVLVLAVIGVLVGAAAMSGLARSLADPITALREAVAELEQGSFDHDVTVDDGSEVGLLQAGFNRMLSGLRERERIRDLFGRQVGEDVVRHALEHGVELGGESREAAMLFVDLEGSTRLAEERDPAEVVSLLNDFFAIVVEVVSDCGGWVNKFEGDAALCAFGVPLSDEACAGQALEAGRRMAQRLHEEMPDIKAGIGVSAGRVVAGNVGAAERFEYTVIGDPVNEAARLSELAKGREEGILASGAALDAAGESEQGHWRRQEEEVELRGRSKPTPVAIPAP